MAGKRCHPNKKKINDRKGVEPVQDTIPLLRSHFLFQETTGHQAVWLLTVQQLEFQSEGGVGAASTWQPAKDEDQQLNKTKSARAQSATYTLSLNANLCLLFGNNRFRHYTALVDNGRGRGAFDPRDMTFSRVFFHLFDVDVWVWIELWAMFWKFAVMPT